MDSKKFLTVLVTIVAVGYANSQVIIEKPLEETAENFYPSYQPFEFAYQSNDGLGTTQHRQEAGDATGTVKGTYGYTDAQGIYRTVDYVADTSGFRALVKSNEPGVANQNTADAIFVVEPPPVGVSTEAAKKDDESEQVLASPSSTVPISVQPGAPRGLFTSYPHAIRPSAVPYPLYTLPTFQAASSPLRFMLRQNAFTPRARAPKLLAAL